MSNNSNKETVRDLEHLEIGDKVYCIDYMGDAIEYPFISLVGDLVIVSADIFAENVYNLLKGIANDSFTTCSIHAFHRENVYTEKNKALQREYKEKFSDE